MSSTARWRVVALLVVCATLIAAAVAPKSNFAQQLVYFLALFVLIIPLHEFGHAIAGAVVGFRILNIVVGAGPPLASFHVLGVAVQINLLPLGGATVAIPKRQYRSPRLRQWIITAGGPLANVAIYLILRRIFGPALSDSDNHPFAWAAAQVNATVLVFNLIPFRTSDGAASDGYGLATIPFWSKQRIEVANLSSQGTHLHREGRHEEARTIWRDALQKATDARQVTMLKNNVAWVDFLIGRDEDLAEADALSQQALAALPESSPIAGTRAAVLIWLGRPGEALPLLAASDAVLFDARSQAYNKALAASALAALGRRDEALLRLAEARRADPDCELIPRAEADIAAGPIAASPVPVPEARNTDPAAVIATLRPWRRDARIVAFISVFLVLERLGLDLAPFIILIVLSFVPELGGVFALAGYGFSVALLHATGFVEAPPFLHARPWVTVLLTFAMGSAACWLIARHRRIGPPPKSATPTVLGWLLAGFFVLSLLAGLVIVFRDHTPLAMHASAQKVVKLAPGFVGLAALLASRKRRGVRLLAIAPVVVALLALVPGSTWYRETVALAEIRPDGAPIAPPDPVPATVVRSRQLTTGGDDATVSPGARAFVVTERVARGRSRVLLHVGDFEGHLVDVNGTAAAFVDDERLLVLRPRSEPGDPDQLVAIRPLGGPAPLWTKDLPDFDILGAAIHIDRKTGDVFITAGNDTDQARPLMLRTTIEQTTPVEASPLVHTPPDWPLASDLPNEGWGGTLVSRRAGRSYDLVWRTLGGERRLVKGLPTPFCADPLPGEALIWCLTPYVPVLLRIDARTASVARLPGNAPLTREPKVLSPSLLAMLNGDELGLLNVRDWRYTALKLPESKEMLVVSLADGALATWSHPWQPGAGTLAVYALPAP